MLFLGAVAQSRRIGGGGGPEPVAGRTTYLIAGGNEAAISAANTTVNLACDGGFRTRIGNETRSRIRLPTAGVLSKLRVFIGTNARTSSTTLALWVNGVESLQKITIPAGVTGWLETDDLGISVSAGDEINYRIVTGSGSGAVLLVRTIILAYEAEDTATCFHLYNMNDAVSWTPGGGTGIPETLYGSLSGFAGITIPRWGSTFAIGPHPNSTPLFAEGTLSDLWFNVTANTSNADCIIRVVEDEVDTNLVITIPAGQTGVFRDTTNTWEVNPGSRYAYKLTTPGRTSGGLSFCLGGVTFKSEAGDWQVTATLIDSATNGGTAAAGTYHVSAGMVMLPSSIEARGQIEMPFGGTIKRLFVDGTKNSGSGAAAFDVITRKNGVDQLQKVVVPVGGSQPLTVSDTLNPVEFVEGDLIGIGYTIVTANQGPSRIGFVISSDE